MTYLPPPPPVAGVFFLPTPCLSSSDKSKDMESLSPTLPAVLEPSLSPAPAVATPIVVSWNIINENGKTLEVRNRTNNAIECYNRRFNDLFPTRPSLLLFVQVVEAKSQNQATKRDKIWTGKALPAMHLEVSIPQVNAGYPPFKVQMDKRKRQAARKKA
jgi:hypothetical protein